MSDDGLSLLAIFVDDKFVKFVRWPKGDAQIKLGDFSILKRAVESDSLSIADLEKELRVRIEPPKEIDPGLLAAWLRFGPDIQKAREPMLKENAKLRDQFNAARLNIGMPRADVQAVFKAVPLESGDVGGYSFQIYGSTKSFDITPDLHYSNVLVVLKDGKMVGVYSGGLVPGGDGLQRMRQWFVDLRDESENQD